MEVRGKDGGKRGMEGWGKGGRKDGREEGRKEGRDKVTKINQPSDPSSSAIYSRSQIFVCLSGWLAGQLTCCRLGVFRRNGEREREIRIIYTS